LRRKNWLLFLLMVFLWGFNWSVMKMGLDFIPPISYVLLRFLFSTLALSSFLLLLRREIPRDKDTLGKLLLLCLINALGIAATNLGLVFEESGTGAVLTYTQPLFVFCLAILFLKEKVKIVRLLGLIMGFMGVAILFLREYSSLTVLSYPGLMMLLGAFTWAVTTVYYKKFLSHVNPTLANTFLLGVGVLPLAALSITREAFTLQWTGTYLGIILYSSLGASAVGSTIWLILLKEEDAVTLSASSFIIPIIALLFGWQLLGENVEVESLIGSSLVLIGVYLVNRV